MQLVGDLKMANPDPLIASQRPAPLPSAVIMSKRGRKSMQQPLHGIILLLHLSRVDAGLLVAGQLHLSPLQSQQEQSSQSEKLHTLHIFIGSIPNNSQNSKNLVALSSLV